MAQGEIKKRNTGKNNQNKKKKQKPKKSYGILRTI